MATLPPLPASGSGGEAQPIHRAWSSRVPADALEWLCWPKGRAAFFSDSWEKKPLHLKRQVPDYYGGLFSKSAFDEALAGGTPIGYGERLNVSRFDAKTGRKVDLNPGPRGTPARAAQVGELWASGAALQVMHAQQFHEPVWRLLSALERGFGALFGCNAYMTPGGIQGLAPHFDDVEVFMLQLEGTKRWRLYEPPEGEEFPLPREYSRDFQPSELGEPVLDITLGPGDLLYVPRGFVHCGVAGDSGFSHHLTVSTYQKTSWCDLLDRALPAAVTRAAESNPEFRQGLPVDFLRYMGSWHDTGGGGETPETAAERAAFLRTFQGLLKRLQEFVDVDEVCDEMGVEFMSQRLPVPPADGAGAGAAGDGAPPGPSADTQVRLVDPAAVRAVLSTDPETNEPTAMLFHTLDNPREAHMKRESAAEEDVGCLRFEAATFLPAIRALLAPGSVAGMRCGDLPLKDEDDRLAICENLLEAGLLEVVPGTQTAEAAAQ